MEEIIPYRKIHRYFDDVFRSLKRSTTRVTMCNGRPTKHVTMLHMQHTKIYKSDTNFLALYLLYECREIKIFPIPDKINITTEISKSE